MRASELTMQSESLRATSNASPVSQSRLAHIDRHAPDVDFTHTAAIRSAIALGRLKLPGTSSAHACSFDGCDVIHINQSTVRGWCLMVAIARRSGCEAVCCNAAAANSA